MRAGSRRPQPAQDEEAAAAAAARAEDGRLKRENFSQRVDDALPWKTKKRPPRRGGRSVGARPAHVEAAAALIEEATPCLEFVAVHGAFDANGEGAAGSSSIKGAYAARPRELFGRGDLAVNARRALPAFCCPDGVPVVEIKLVGRVLVITESSGVRPTPPRRRAGVTSMGWKL